MCLASCLTMYFCIVWHGMHACMHDFRMWDSAQCSCSVGLFASSIWQSKTGLPADGTLSATEQPANTIRSPNAGLMLSRWPDIKTALGQRVVLPGSESSPTPLGIYKPDVGFCVTVPTQKKQVYPRYTIPLMNCVLFFVDYSCKYIVSIIPFINGAFIV